MAAMASGMADDALLLEHGVGHVWWAWTMDANSLLATLLSAEELQRWTALRHSSDRQRFLVGCAVVRLALAGYLRRSPSTIELSRACARCGKPHGKPRLVPLSPNAPQFSTSHSGSRVAVAFARGSPLGIDVERVTPRAPVAELAPSTLSPREREEVGRLDPGERARAFLVYWTRKEAVLKATGRGLGVPLAGVEVSGSREPARLTAFAEHEDLVARVCLLDLDAGLGYVASLAAIGPCPRIVPRDGSALIASWLAATQAPPSA